MLYPEPVMLIVDGHLDLGWLAVQWNRDITRSVPELRAGPYFAVPAGPGEAARTDIVPSLGLPEMRQGRVGLCFATMLARSTGQPVPHYDYPSPQQAYAAARGQLSYYRALEKAGLMRSVRDVAALDGHVAEWEAWDKAPGGKAPPIGYILAMEGADPILEPAQLGEWHASGLRALSLSHFGTGRYAGGTASGLGLTALGPPLLKEMRRLRMILDVSHLDEPGFWEALGLWDGPVMASHSNCRALVPHSRQLSDEQVREVVKRGGVIGSVFDAWMLVPGWERGKPGNVKFTMESVADHIDHVCQLAGNSRHAAIGSDIDGGFGKEQEPQDMDTIADLQKLMGILRKRGHSDADVAAILHGNWLRLLREAWA
jgi:membrane dipeptidase